MEVSEIVEIFICEKTGVVNVKFRMVNDSEDTVRMDTIELETLSDFGYTSSYIDMDFFDVDEDYELDFIDDSDFFIDDVDMMSFLNEYYIVYSDRIPEEQYI